MLTRLGDSVYRRKVLMLYRQNEIFAVAASSMLAIDVRELIDGAHGRVHPYNYM